MGAVVGSVLVVGVGAGEAGWLCATAGVTGGTGRHWPAVSKQVGQALVRGCTSPPFQRGLPSTASRRFKKGPSSAQEANEGMPYT